MHDWQVELDAAIDRVLYVLEHGAAAGVELDPLTTIMQRLQARGQSLDLSDAPPVMRMLLAGMMPE